MASWGACVEHWHHCCLQRLFKDITRDEREGNTSDSHHCDHTQLAFNNRSTGGWSFPLSCHVVCYLDTCNIAAESKRDWLWQRKERKSLLK